MSFHNHNFDLLSPYKHAPALSSVLNPEIWRNLLRARF